VTKAENIQITKSIFDGALSAHKKSMTAQTIKPTYLIQ
jgi:hypothetical protein